jgi:integrase
MARAVNKLTSLEISRKSRPGRYGDGGGLYLVVTRSGTRSWAFRYERSGKAHEMGLGSAETIGLAEARRRATRCRQHLLDGIDPLVQRRAAQGTVAVSGLTFAAVAGLYITAHAPAWRSAVHAGQWRSTLRQYVLPVIGEVPVAAIDTGMVMRILEPLWPVKTETASRLRGRIEAVLDYASARGWRAGENPARWRGHLANLLPARGKLAPVEHHPAMAWGDVPGFMQTLAARSGAAACALRFIVLTAARSGEARGALWREINPVERTWTIPASRTKAAKEHRVSLAAPALALLEDVSREAEQVAPDGLVFPGQAAHRPVSDVALAKLLPAGVTVHGFRAAFRTWAAETTGHPREVIEMALAHRVGDAVEQAYARGDLFDKRRRLMEDWAAFCIRPPQPAGTAAMHRSRRAAAAP